MTRLLGEGPLTNDRLPAQERMRLLDMEEELLKLSLKRDSRCKASAEHGVVLPLCRIVDCFGLDAYERDIVLLAAAAQLDVKYGKLFGFVQDDATNQRPTVALAIRLLGADETEPLRLLRYWLPSATLRGQQLIALKARPAEAYADSLIGSVMKLEDGIAQYMMQPDLLDARLAGIAVLAKGARGTEGTGGTGAGTAQAQAGSIEQLTGQLAAAVSRQRLGLRQLAGWLSGSQPAEQPMDQLSDPSDLSPDGQPYSAPVYLLHGPAGSGKAALATRACEHAGVPLLLADVSRMPDDASDCASLLRLACREASLRGAALGLLHAELLNTREAPASCWTIVQEQHARGAVPTILFGDNPFVPAVGCSGNAAGNIGGSGGWPVIEIGLPMPAVRERAAIWQDLVGQSGVEVDESVNWLAIAEQYKLTAGVIRDAWQLAMSLSVWRADGKGYSGKRNPTGGISVKESAVRPDCYVTAEDIREACRRQKQHRLDDIATRIVPQYSVEHLVLPIDQTLKIKQIINQQKQRHRVLTEWNFHGKLSRGKGTNVLFAGPPGTGKTMAAEAIAGELGLDLYRIDLSQIISKYIGETEKNLRRLFHEAEHSNAVLLFDEADALFGKRSEVKDSHDRHANTEVAYLLQKMEEYDGMSILATNLQYNMDEAFARRMAFRIEFQIPEIEHRHRLWLSMFPAEAPRDPDIDYAFLARNIRLSGGNIKNAALTAAYLAAEEAAPIGMRHLIRAVRQEFDKLGKLCLREDFGPYYDWS
jgi:AAA+ superfamily predicted ATPase